MKSFLLACALLASSTYGHMQMAKPYPIRSPLNPDGGDNKDYSYTNPLSSSGSDFPCKGYQNDPFKSVASYIPGQEYEMEFQGSATHSGGSCQISLSYDTGKSFQVIESILGGCPLQSSYKFKIPADAASGQALLAWTWFNKVGNREMYMNCAQVTIGAGSAKRQSGFTSISRREAFSNLPPMFQANINGPGQCKTIEGEEVNFPLPGPAVLGSLSGQGYQCSGSAPFLGGSSTPSSASSSSTSTSTSTSKSTSTSTSASSSSTSGSAHGSSTTPSSTSSSAKATMSSILAVDSNSSRVSSSSSIPSAATPSLALPSSAPEYPVDGSEDNSCIPGTIICAEDGNSWWLCSEGVPVYMGGVAAGTQCVNGGMHTLR